jgi:hypothetical protein
MRLTSHDFVSAVRRTSREGREGNRSSVRLIKEPNARFCIGALLVNFRNGLIAATMALTALAVAACGGGSVNTTPISPAAPTAPAIQALSFTPVAGASAIPATGGTLPTLTATGGTAATLTLPAQAAGGVTALAAALLSATAPAGPPVLSSIDRRSAQSESSPISGILYISFSLAVPPPATSITLTAAPSFSFTLPASYFSLPNTSFYLAVYDPSHPSLGWQSRQETCTPAAATLTLACGPPQPPSPVTILNNVTYTIALYAVSTSAVAPTPQPSANPTAVATNTPAAFASGTVTLVAGTPIALPSAAGASGTLTLGAVSASTTATVALYLQVPPGFPAPATTYPAPLFYVFTPAATITVSGSSSGTFNPPTGYNTNGAGSNTCPFIEMYDTSRTTGWYLKALGPGTCTGGNTTFTTTQPMTLTGGVTYAFGVYPSN